MTVLPLYSMSSPLLGRAALFGLLLCSCGSDEIVSADERRPDVLLFVIDTLRKDHLSCYGYGRPTSPTLDQLAAEGTLFEDPVAQCSWTKPSMVSMFSGRYVTSYRDIPFADAPTLAERFETAGYRTIGVVGNYFLDEKGGFARGFQWYDARSVNRPGDGRRVGRPLQDLARDLWPVLEQALVHDEGEARPPLFVYVHAMDPHAPYFHHEELARTLPLEGAPEIDEWQREIYAERGAAPPVEDPGWESSWTAMHEARGRYDREIRHTDQVLAQMLEHYREVGLLDHSIVAVVADHGEVLHDHPRHGKFKGLAEAPPERFFHREHFFYMYQNLIGTPFILWGTGVPRGVKVEEPIENVDLYPTLLELAQLPITTELHGRSLTPLMRDEKATGVPYVHSFVLHNESIREVATQLKLIRPTEVGATEGMKPALYDLHVDPDERVNLYDERPEDVARLSAALDRWRERHPTETSLGRKISEQERRTLSGLGYTGDWLVPESVDEEEHDLAPGQPAREEREVR